MHTLRPRQPPAMDGLWPCRRLRDADAAALTTRCWTLDAGCWSGRWMVVAGCWSLDAGRWMLDASELLTVDGRRSCLAARASRTTG